MAEIAGGLMAGLAGLTGVLWWRRLTAPRLEGTAAGERVRRGVIAFDFDGTLADTLEIALQSYNEVAPTFRLPPVARETLPELRRLGTDQLLRRFGVRWWRLPLIVQATRKEMSRRLGAVQLFPGVPEALRELEGQGYQLVLFTSNSWPNVERVLAPLGLDEVFTVRCTEVGLRAKAPALRQILRRLAVPPERLVVVGDEARDVIAAKRCGSPAVAVSWGYHEKSKLLESGPASLVGRPNELVAALTPILSPP